MSEQCDSHDNCMERINENMKKIEVNYAEMKGEIKGFVSSVNDFLNAIRKDIYASDGLMTTMNQNKNQIGLQWGILIIIIVAIIGTAIKIIVK